MKSLVAWRTRNALTTKEAAAALGVTAQSLYNWEAGRNTPSPRHLRNIAKVTGVSIDRIVKEATRE